MTKDQEIKQLNDIIDRNIEEKIRLYEEIVYLREKIKKLRKK